MTKMRAMTGNRTPRLWWYWPVALVKWIRGWEDGDKILAEGLILLPLLGLLMLGVMCL